MFSLIFIVVWTLYYKVCLFENQKDQIYYIKGQNMVTWKILLYDTFEHSIEQGLFTFMMPLLGFWYDIFR